MSERVVCAAAAVEVRLMDVKAGTEAAEDRGMNAAECSKKTRNKVGGVARVGRDRTRGAWTVIGTERDGLQQGGMGKVANEIDQNVARQGPRIELRVSRSETWTAAKEEATQSQ